MRARQRVQPPEEQDRRLGVPDVSRAVVRVQRAPATSRASALRVVDLDSSPVMLLARFERLVERRARGRTVRRWRGHVDEWEQRVDERAGVLGAGELREAEASAVTLRENKTSRGRQGEKRRQCVVHTREGRGK